VAYDRFHNNMPKQLRRGIELYDKKIHGKPFDEDDLVWLHSPVVKHGRSRKLHLPWSGPYRVVKNCQMQSTESRNFIIKEGG